MPSWAAPNPTTQATVARASKAFLRDAAMAAKERLAGGWGGRLPSLHQSKGQQGRTALS